MKEEVFEGETITLINSTVTDNSADEGGGIYGATVTMIDSTLSNNRAKGGGGGIYNDGSFTTMTLTNSTISGNTAVLQGGGIYNQDGTVTLTNSTISGNTATGDGGGIYNLGETAVLTSTNSTIAGNTAGGLGGGIRNAAATTQLLNTIIARNTAPTGPDCSGLPTSMGYNIIGDDTGCGMAPATGDMLNVDPMLKPLRPNGGPTDTHALRRASPALDAIPVDGCNDADGVPVATDQRGLARPQGPACDIGSYEQRQR